MIRRVLTLGLVAALAQVARAGVVVDLVPSCPSDLLFPPGAYNPGETATITVRLYQSPPGTTRSLRMIKFHFDDTNPALLANMTFNWTVGAVNHFRDSSNTSGPPGVAIAYTGLAVDLANQVQLPGDGTPVNVATITISPVPVAPGPYILNLVNADEPNADLHANVAFGFGSIADTNPAGGPPGGDGIAVTHLEAGTADLTGGFMTLITQNDYVLVPKPLDSNGAVNPRSLWRQSRNTIRLTFDSNIAHPADTDCQIEIRQLLGNGLLGANQGSNFLCRVENDPNQGGNPRILRIREGNVASDPVVFLTHRTWWSFRNLAGWSGGPAFEVQEVVNVGDFNGDRVVLAGDVGGINAVLNPVLDDNRADIDGNGARLASDVALANSKVGGGLPGKPGGHCN